MSNNFGNADFWVLKLDANGALTWEQTYGGTEEDKATGVYPTLDGGYIVAGHTASNDNDVLGNHGNLDFWAVKLDKDGVILWQKPLGGTGSDHAGGVQQTSDGGYILTGYTGSDNGDVSGNHGGWDFWLVKLSADGLGTQEVAATNAVLFPNPVADLLTIQASDRIADLKVYSSEGKLVKSVGQVNRKTTEINLSSLKSGYYLVSIGFAVGKVKTYKILKK